MKKFKFRNCTEEELWKYVGTHLEGNGLNAVLVGGAVVSIYSSGAYRSGDLDFIIQNLFKEELPQVMKQIGFEKQGRHYVHPECQHLFIEFPLGPLGIGGDTSIQPDVKIVEGKRTRILSPTDCIKDRLASYIYFNARECLDQALLVARAQPYDLHEVKRWCAAEDAEWAYAEFNEMIGKS